MAPSRIVKGFIAIGFSVCFLNVSAHEIDRWDAKILYQISSESWVKTKTARVDIAINLALQKESFAKARSTMLSNLQTLAATNWEISSFSRNRDASGLEQINATATTRLPETGLDGLRAAATKMSHPGSYYNVANIDFTPSLEESENARDGLRLGLMSQVKKQLDEIKKMYPDQNYQIAQINFQPETFANDAMQEPRMFKAEMMSAGASRPASSGLAISQKIQITAQVLFAVPRKNA